MKYLLQTTYYSLLIVLLQLPTYAAAATTLPTGSGADTPVTDGGGGRVGAGAPPVTINNPLKSESLIGFFQDLLNAVMVLAVPIIILFIIFAGFKYVTARGNSEQIGQAHKALLYAILGGVLILGAQVLLAVIQGTVNEFAA